MRKQLALLGSAFLAWALATGAQAGVSQAQANKLGKTLTPFGAQIDGNSKDVSTGLGIPKWTGGITSDMIPKSYTHPGQFHPTPFPNDKTLFTINVQNMDKYAGKLTNGVKAMMKEYPDTFHMNVYRSRRTTSAPSWVNKNTKKNAVTAKLVHGGNGVTNAHGGIPFPVLHGSNSEKALEAVWNHIMRWRGVYVVMRQVEAAVQPDGDFVPYVTQQEVYIRYYDPRATYKDLHNTLLYYLTFTLAPARLSGGAVLVRDTINQAKEPRQAWGYNAGLRRVRRAPNIAFDMPVPSSDGLITADQIDMYNGSPDKYNWKLVHAHPVEKFIPYNNYKLNDPDLKYKDIIKPDHIDSDLVRWELHRVWVVEGNLKPDERHIYHRRRFYIDADSWQIVEADMYDSRDKLWRVSLGYMMNYYEVPVQWTVNLGFYDLRSHRYDFRNLITENDSDRDFTQPIPNRRYFSPAALSRRGR